MRRAKCKIAVITGAGSGLGRSLAIALAKKRWWIAVSDVNEESAAATLRLVRHAGGSGEAYVCDVTKLDQIEAMAEKIYEEWACVDLLVNNAGVAAAGHVGDMPTEDWRWIMDINMWGPIYGCHVFIPRFKKQGGRAHIVNIASNAGIASMPEMGSYNVTKAAIISLSETLRSELAPEKIGVTVVCPTFFKSNLHESLRAVQDDQLEIAHNLIRRSKLDSDHIAECVIRAVNKNRLYVIPQFDGKVVWWAKRLSPELYFKALSLGNKLVGKKILMKHRSR